MVLLVLYIKLWIPKLIKLLPSKKWNKNIIIGINVFNSDKLNPLENSIIPMLSNLNKSFLLPINSIWSSSISIMISIKSILKWNNKIKNLQKNKSSIFILIMKKYRLSSCIWPCPYAQKWILSSRYEALKSTHV